eukprot:6428948-Amphidinium_carterae.1
MLLRLAEKQSDVEKQLCANRTVSLVAKLNNFCAFGTWSTLVLMIVVEELILPPTRWQTLQSACPNIIHVRVQGKGRDVAHGHRMPVLTAQPIAIGSNASASHGTRIVKSPLLYYMLLAIGKDRHLCLLHRTRRSTLAPIQMSNARMLPREICENGSEPSTIGHITRVALHLHGAFNSCVTIMNCNYSPNQVDSMKF